MEKQRNYCFNEFSKNIKMHLLYYHVFLSSMVYLVWHFILSIDVNAFLTIYGLLAPLHIMLMTFHVFLLTTFNLQNKKIQNILPLYFSIYSILLISLILFHESGQQNLHWLSAKNKTTTIIQMTKHEYMIIQ